jgi:hypothetical protein
MMLEAFGVTDENWRGAVAKVPHFVISETLRFVGRGVAALAADPRSCALERAIALQRRAGEGSWLH